LIEGDIRDAAALDAVFSTQPIDAVRRGVADGARPLLRCKRARNEGAARRDGARRSSGNCVFIELRRLWRA
jgi:hypothetical protein